MPDFMPWHALPNVVAVALFVALAVFIELRRPRAPLRVPLLLSLAAATAFALGDLLTQAATDLTTKQVAIALINTGTLCIPPAWWWLALRFASVSGVEPFRGRRWVLGVPVAFAATMWLVMLSNPLHGHYVTPVLGDRNVHHALWWVAFAGSYTTVLAVCGLYAGLCLRRASDNRVRWQSATLLAGTLLPLGVNAVYNIAPGVGARMDPTVAALAGTCVLLVTGILGARLFALSPVSLRAVIRHDRSGVLIVDAHGRLDLANEAARRILGDPQTSESEPVALLASRLRFLASEDAVPETELWGLVQKSDDAGGGSLYRLRGDTSRLVWISLASVPSRWSAIAAWCFRIQDVTQLYETERERARLEERLRRSLIRLHEGPARSDGLARELTRPLATIRAVADYGLLVQQSRGDDPIMADCLEAIAREAERCERLTENAASE